MIRSLLWCMEGILDEGQKQDRACVELAAGLVAFAHSLHCAHILANGRGSHTISRARQEAMYLSYVGFGMSLSRVATAFRRDRSTVAHARHQIEDRRDDPAFDKRMHTLEKSLGAIATLMMEAA